MKDRTREFQDLIQDKSQSQNRQHKPRTFRPPSQFASQSVQVGKNLRNIEATVEKYSSRIYLIPVGITGTVVQKDSLFDDRSEEIARLTQFIKQSIDSSRRDIEILEQSRKREYYRFLFSIHFNSSYSILISHLVHETNEIFQFFLIFHFCSHTRRTKSSAQHAETIVGALHGRLREVTKIFSDGLAKRSKVIPLIHFFPSLLTPTSISTQSHPRLQKLNNNELMF